MNRTADFEIGIHRRDGQTYTVEIRLLPPGADEEVRPESGLLQLDLDALRAATDDKNYGAALGNALLSDRNVSEAFGTARRIAETNDVALRVRLMIGPTAPELHALRWEATRTPDSQSTLFTGEDVLFSRYVISGDWRPLRAKSELRALAFVANPSDIQTTFHLPPVDSVKLLAPVQDALGPALVTPERSARATLNYLLEQLHAGFDVLYLVCHGQLIKGQPKLYLEKEDGTADVIPGADFVARLSELRVRPRLIVLASCQSAGTADQQTAEGYMVALGPHLAESGIPAVVAMQGTVSTDTVKLFMKGFFKTLSQEGIVDGAMSTGRTAALLAKRPDWWMPILFMRLKSGRVWYEPGFADSGNEFEKWKSICNSVLNGDFIPILGPELGEDMFGGTRELAARLAEEHAFPLASHDKTDLAKVTQYLTANQDPNFVMGDGTKLGAVEKEFLRQLSQRLGGGAGNDAPTTLKELLDLATQRCVSDPDHSYRILADLPASIFLNAGYEPILFKTLKAIGKNPEAIATSWRGIEIPKQPKTNSETPAEQMPWVYHIFGLFGKPNTMVLTEDDFFDYLIATSKLDLLLPTLVGRLMQSSLLFLGFRLDDWRFRVLFRMIVTRQGTATMKLGKLSHVGVQVNPDEQTFADVERTKNYMTSYFRGRERAPEISIYWGSAADFLKELRTRLAGTKKESTMPVIEGGGDDWL